VRGPSSLRLNDRLREHYEVAIVGAGIAGATCARALGEGGMRVALIEQRPAERAGARWVNGVPLDAFEDARITAPTAEELHGRDAPFVLVANDARLSVEPGGLLEVDMRALGARLRDRAMDAGVNLLCNTPVGHVECNGGRIEALHLADRLVTANVFVDASGLAAVLRRAVFPHWPDVAQADLCLAAQEVRHVTDRAGAELFLRDHGVRDGETVSFGAIVGGYSVLNATVRLDRGEVSLLAGAIAGVASGAQMLRNFCAEHRWIGDRIFGGAGALPVRRPYSRLVASGLALLGDAACQVFPAHGSGIAIGMRAARLLADTILTGRDLWSYAVRFHREHGGLLAAYDIVRRFTQRLSREEAELLFASGLASKRAVAAALLQEVPRPDVLSLLRGLPRAPRLARAMAIAGARAAACMAISRTYPISPRDLPTYERRMARAIGVAPDPVT
jgi:menaquinone-9 beta-reductase